MRNSVAFALLLSLLFIGTAVWARTGNFDSSTPTLVGVENSPSQDVYNDEFFLDQQNATGTRSNLSNTDLISRQMMLEYFDLAAKGQATPQNISALTDKYADRIPSLNNPPQIELSAIRTVADTKANLQYYESEMNRLQEKFATQMKAAYSSVKDLKTESPALYSFLETFGNTYNESSVQMKNLPVPQSVALPHLRLINSYMASAYALITLSEKESDATAGFASASLISESLAEQNDIVSEISAILIKNGI